uniref:Uncharacterized protein n=1 Tax=Parascaris equorum TaxID=6256 RepID=A0A914RGX0_PAREQ
MVEIHGHEQKVEVMPHYKEEICVNTKMARENEDECPSFLWYFVASFGYTLLILLILVAYLIMYSSHFMWALSKKKGPKCSRSLRPPIYKQAGGVECEVRELLCSDKAVGTTLKTLFP